MELFLIGIGTGNPEHLTLQAIRLMNDADLILIPRKGAGKEDLADLRRDIIQTVVPADRVKIAEFDLPVRDPQIADYKSRVDQWHDAIAVVWQDTMARHPQAQKVALLVWGDPSLYDSTLRIAGRLSPCPKITVVPGITSIQGLTAAHSIPLNDIGAPFVVTTGRRLRDEGWPDGVDTAVFMLDGDCSFQTLRGQGRYHLWWGAYVGMKEQTAIEGRLDDVCDTVIQTRAQLREEMGWIMDIYLIRRL